MLNEIILTLGDSIFAGNDAGFTFRSALLEIDPTLEFSGLYTDVAGHLHLSQSGASIHELVHPGRVYALQDRLDITCVFVLCGFNNYRQNDSSTVMIRAINDLVRCFENDTNAQIYIAKLYQPNPQYSPWGNQNLNRQVLTEYNDYIDLLSSSRSRVTSVDTNSMRWFMLKDGVHPNQQGFRVLAQSFINNII